MVGHRKKTGVLATLLVIAGLLFIAYPLYSADTADDPFPKRQRPSVDFLDELHDLHMENQDCLSCHHKYEDGENVLEEDELEEDNPDIRCASCHNGSADLGLQKAYHRQCIGCHDNLSDAGETTGPSLCGECHIRKKANE